jgi:oligopeptide/dipeptide ABC transporter ATP-binding protein
MRVSIGKKSYGAGGQFLPAFKERRKKADLRSGLREEPKLLSLLSFTPFGNRVDILPGGEIGRPHDLKHLLLNLQEESGQLGLLYKFSITLEGDRSVDGHHIRRYQGISNRIPSQFLRPFEDIPADLSSRIGLRGMVRRNEAPVKELFKDPRHPYTRGLLGSIPVIGRKVQTGRRLHEIPGVVPSLLRMPQGCRFHPRCPEAVNTCREQEPPMVSLGEHRRVNCWLEVKNPGKEAPAPGQSGME